MRCWPVVKTNSTLVKRGIKTHFERPKVISMSEETRPAKVSVIIPSYNTAGTVSRALSSVLETQCPDLEIIIVDDGSSDDSIKTIERYISDHPGARILLLTHPNHHNKGIAATRNLALKRVSGKYVAFLDADDVFLKNRFNECVAILDADESIDAVVEPFQFRYESGDRGKVEEAAPKVVPSPGAGQPPRSCEQIFFEFLNGSNAAHTSSITIRSEVFAATGGFPAFKYCLEKPLWLKICARNRVVDGAREPVAEYVLHENSTCAKEESTAEFLSEYSSALMDAYTWMSKHGVRVEYMDAVRRLAISKFYHYCTIVLNHSHSFGRDIILPLWRSFRVFPDLVFTAKYWIVCSKLIAAKMGIVRGWHDERR